MASVLVSVTMPSQSLSPARSSGTGKLNFDSFVRVVGHFLEEQDEEAMQKELKEAFRLYDKEGEIASFLFIFFPSTLFSLPTSFFLALFIFPFLL